MGNEKRYADLDYETAVQKFSDTVTRICAVRCRNLEDTKDCYQTVFLKLFMTDTEFQSETHLKSWLIRASISTSLDCVKQYWKQKVVLNNNSDISILLQTLKGTQPDSKENRQAHDTEIMELVLSLPVKYAQVIFLYYYEEYKVAEIAELLSESAGTVKSQLFRGRKLLEKELRKRNIGGIADEKVM